MSPWTIGWLLWGGWFAVEEGWALRTVGRRGTLSWLVWTLGGTRKGLTRGPGPWLRVRRIGLLAVMAWLTVHFLTGGAV
jgi:hypothetical protein